MGAEPKTKSEIRARIAELQGQIASAKARIANKTGSAYTERVNISNAQAEIAKLKAKLPDAPK